MQKILAVFKWFSIAVRFVLLIWAAIWTFPHFGANVPLSVLALAAILLLIFSDVGRRFIPIVRKHPVFRCVMAIVLCVALLAMKKADIIQVYYFFLLDDIFDMGSGKTQKSLIAVHGAGFFGVSIVRLVLQDRETQQCLKDILLLIACYGLVLFIFAVVHYFKAEQARLKVLNGDLIAYSFEEREYLLAKERSRISQELHDSIGHSLMAVLMNVRYLKVIQTKSQEEKDRQIDEIEELLKECVSNLRSSVCSLRELDETIDLQKEIGRIIDKFDQLGLVKINLSYDDEVNAFTGRVKSVLFKTIREGITNSIRHGGATFVQISIRRLEKQVELIVKDNGSGCADIRKSFGLNGIVERVRETGGEVWFLSAKNKGFTIKVLLPGGDKT